jgi:hypothetical protein
MATASSRSRKVNRTKRATHITIADVEDGDTRPDPLPTTYIGLIVLLRRYIVLLQIMFGEHCSHRQFVLNITLELVQQAQLFESISAREIASLVWQIFVDSRRFFSDGVDRDGSLPRSRLAHVYNHIAAGHIPIQTRVPYHDLLSAGTVGQEEATARIPTERKEGQRGRGGEGPHRYTKVPAEIKAVLAGALAKHPTITVAKVMAAESPPVPYTKMKLGGNGHCLDFLALGLCSNKACSFIHDSTTVIHSNQAIRTAAVLKGAYRKFEANGG